jgi:hypothetical protein
MVSSSAQFYSFFYYFYPPIWLIYVGTIERNGHGCGRWNGMILHCLSFEVIYWEICEIWILGAAWSSKYASVRWRNEKRGHGQLKGRNAEIAAIKCKYDSLVFAVIVFVLGVDAWKLLFQWTS